METILMYVLMYVALGMFVIMGAGLVMGLIDSLCITIFKRTPCLNGINWFFARLDREAAKFQLALALKLNKKTLNHSDACAHCEKLRRRLRELRGEALNGPAAV